MLGWIASDLSPEQQEPFKRSTANACILAGAGSGKTKTLVNLIAADIAAGVPASGIVAFTFTVKAAEELLARIHVLAKHHFPDISLTGMYVGTIHGWCLQYLIEQSDFYNFMPIDELHVDALASRLYDALELKETYGQSYPHGITKFLSDIEVLYNEHLSLKQVPDKIKGSVGKFLDVLQGNHLMTFGGMIRYATDHLRANGSVGELKSLYVDEYQDVNPAQVELIKIMLPGTGQVVVVGDELQCIYNWRGSDVVRILNFQKEFNDASIHRLTKNFRARPSIVNLGNRVAGEIRLRDTEKIMVPGRDDLKCESVIWLSLNSEEEQAPAVIDICKRFAANGIQWNKMAILLRSLVKWGKPFVDALIAEGIPVQCPILSRGGEFINEFLLPVLSWLRVDHHEPKNEMEEAEAEEEARRLWDGVKKWVSVPNAEVVFWEGLNQWLDSINKERDESYDVRGRLYDLLNICGVRIGYDDGDLMVGLGIASQIIRSVEEIHRRRLAGHQRRSPKGVVSEVYFAVQRNQQDFGESVTIDTAAEGVVVTTVHQAKGLEWPIVIIPTLMRNRFPVRARSHGTSFPKEVAGRYGTSMEDERRLFYVAATRAKERLFLLDGARNKPKDRSVFLEELKDREVVAPSDLSDIDQNVWKIDKEDLRERDPTPLRIGLSDILLYVECPYQFGLRRVVAVQPSVGQELGFGKGLHELIQRRYEAKQQWTSAELREQVERHIFLPYMSEKAEALSRKSIENRIKKLDSFDAFSAEVEPEMPVEVLLDGGIIYGIIDCVQLNKDGSVLIRDWKTNIHENLVPRYERQLQFYAYALRLQGRRVSEAEIIDVAASAEQNKLVGRQVDISEGTVSELIKTLNHSLKRVTKMEYAATPHTISCSCCDMFRLCPERIDGETV